MLENQLMYKAYPTGITQNHYIWWKNYHFQDIATTISAVA